MATLTLADVKKFFGDTEVIKGVDVEISEGEFIVIVGPSGCGKSTLLRMVAGLETVSSGEIAINGNRVNDKEPMDRDIAMVFQNYALYPHMSVRKNMAYGLKIAGMPKQEIKNRVDDAAKLLQLSEYLERKPRQLSGGQRQRVAMGRAIVREPAVFLFDEPLSNLDAKLRVQMRLEIKQLQARLGVTSLYVTHDQVEAMTMADRMIVLNDGVAEQIGSPLDVYERPQTLFAAQFIGSPAMNIVDGSIDGNRLQLANGTTLPCDTEHQGAVKVGIRPEHLVISDSSSRSIPDTATTTVSPANSNNQQEILTLEIKLTEPLGGTTLLHGNLPGLQANSSSPSIPFTASLPGVLRQSDIGSTINLSVLPGNLHLFDAATSQRIN